MEFNFNLEGKNSVEIFGISEDRIKEIVNLQAKVLDEIVNDSKPYEWTNKEDSGLIKGKVLERLLKDVSGPQETLLVVSAMDRITNTLVERIAKRKVIDELPDILKSLFKNI